jgi:hypothetical protein
MDAPKPTRIVIESLGDLSQKEYLWAACRACFHSSMLDLGDLIAWHGADYPIARLRKRLKCRQCGASDPDLKQGHAGGRVGFHE